MINNKRNFILKLILLLIIFTFIVSCGKSGIPTEENKEVLEETKQESVEEELKTYDITTVEELLPEAKEVHLRTALDLQMDQSFNWINKIEKDGLFFNTYTNLNLGVNNINTYIWNIFELENQLSTLSVENIGELDYYKLTQAQVDAMLKRAFSNSPWLGKLDLITADINGVAWRDGYAYFPVDIQYFPTSPLTEFTVEVEDIASLRTFIVKSTGEEEISYRVVYEKGLDDLYRLIDMTSEHKNIYPENSTWLDKVKNISDNPYAGYILYSHKDVVYAAEIWDNTITITTLDKSNLTEKNSVKLSGEYPAFRIKSNGLNILLDDKVIALDENLNTLHETMLPDIITDKTMASDVINTETEEVTTFAGYDINSKGTRIAYATDEGLMMYDITEEKNYVIHSSEKVLNEEDGTYQVYMAYRPMFSFDDTQIIATTNTKEDETAVIVYDFQKQEKEIYGSDYQQINPKNSNLGYESPGLGSGYWAYLGKDHYVYSQQDYFADGRVTTNIYRGSLNNPDMEQADMILQADGSYLDFIAMLEDGSLILASGSAEYPDYFILN